jgi:Zinc-ribbon containing domain
MEKQEKGKIGEIVQISGNYVCDNCGHYQAFDKGDEFEDCESCYEPEITWELES